MSDESEPTDPSLDALIQYSMVFLAHRLDEHGHGQLPAGSGTLVEIGGRKGILTAGHVLKELFSYEESEFKIAVLNKDRITFTGITTDRALCTPFCLMEEPVTEEGPDIGFLALPETTIQSLLTNWNFHNLDQRLDILTEFKLPPKLRVVVMGSPAALSTNKEVTVVSRTDRHEVLQMVGNTSGYWQTSEGHDTFAFHPKAESAGLPVENFKGVSGGGTWVVGVDGELGSRFLYGVAFFQTDPIGDTRDLVCNGPASIYAKLRDLVLASFKAESLWTGLLPK